MAYATATETLKMDFDRVESRLTSILPEIDPTVRAHSTSPVAILAGEAIQTIISSFDAADAALEQAASTITNSGINAPRAMRQLMAKAATDVSNTIAGLLATATSTADALAAKLTKMTMVSRPPASDLVLQEAQISATKTDILMVLDRSTSSNLASTTADLIADYASQDDVLAVWILTASPWMALYFKARGVDLDDLTCLIPNAVGGVDNPEQVLARQVLDAFSGRSGIRALVVIAGAIANLAANDLRKTYGIAAA